ncbi:hypothetical protein [Tropicimonas sp. S265A]
MKHLIDQLTDFLDRLFPAAGAKPAPIRVQVRSDREREPRQ